MVRILINRPVRLTTMSVVTDTGQRISLSSSPVTFDYQNAATVGTMDRPGKKKISRVTAPGTAAINFSHTVASLDWHQSVLPQLNALLDLGRAGRTVRFVGGSSLEQSTWWTIVNMSVAVHQRTPNNEPSRCTVQWSLIEAVDVGNAPSVPTYTPTPVAPTIAPRVIVPVTPTVRTYTVVPGDSLWAIAQRFLGNGARWPEVWNMNQHQIANPNLIRPGQVLRIPAG